MCGITGICQLGGDAVGESDLLAMTDAIAHRGPDGEGHYRDGPVGFGHRRLAIIDPSPAGSQPMRDRGRALRASATTARSTTSGSCAAELEALGHRFRSRTDTEVVLNALASGERDALDALQRHVRARPLGSRARASCCSPATASGSSRSTTRRAATPCSSASEVKAILAHPGLSR